ncbi:MAG: beta-lactamase family protein, partial [Blastocatellia bacterium]|nr:beta-lactamase family protein [Blastocatellia bacterium]
MRLKIVTELIFVVLITAGSALAQSGPFSSTEELDRYLDGLVKADKFAGTVLIAKKGQPIFRRAYGLASREYGTPNRPDTKFNLGSICKTFTQIAIGQLIDEGKLTMDDTIGMILPDYPNQQARESVTVRQLLSMTSGIGDIFNDKFRSIAKDRIRTIADYLPLFASDPLAFEPGTGYLYSNGGYVVLGAIIEKVSGLTYYDYVHEYIFKPIGMEQTGFYQEDDLVPNRASGYTQPGSTRGGGAATKATTQAGELPLVNNIYQLPARGSSAGGGYSTIDDLLKYARAIDSGELQIPNFATGQLPQSGSRTIMGGAPGVNAALSLDVAGVYTVIVLANL